MEYCTVHYFEMGFAESTEQTILIPKGKITPSVVKAFTSGQCHALALALHEHTGWGIVGLFDVDYDDDKYGTPNHVAVQSPDGLVDIKGLGAEHRWHGLTPFPVTKKQVLTYSDRELWDSYYLEPQLAVAEEYVKPVLEAVQNQKKTGIIPLTNKGGL